MSRSKRKNTSSNSIANSTIPNRQRDGSRRENHGDMDSHSGQAGSRSGLSKTPPSSIEVLWLTLLNLMIIWLCVGQLVPAVNEAHYLPKAKHVFFPDFAKRDLFIASGNAHLVFSLIAGGLSCWMPLTAVAWLGRIASWIWVAFAWQGLVRTLAIPRSIGPVALAAWILATHWGNWSGEWAVGGFEGKSLAYPSILTAMQFLVLKRWSSAWFWFAISVVFHPLVGIWAGSTGIAVWWFWGRQESPLSKQILPWTFAFLVSLVGIGPALMMLGGPSRLGPIVTAQIHAFFRLAHHQTPHLFAWQQHVSGAITFVLFVASTVWLWLTIPNLRKHASFAKTFLPIPFLGSRFTPGKALSSADCSQEPILWIVRIAWVATGIALIGLAIDLCLVPLRPDIAAGLLRFYWFRWFDVAAPMAWTLAVYYIASRNFYCDSPNETSASLPRTSGFANVRSLAPLAIACALTSGLLLFQFQRRINDRVPQSDRSILLSDSPTLASGPEVIDDWRSVCRWIDMHTPQDSLFFTPRAQQTFKWYASRAEVVNYKDVPQDGPALLIWFDRIERCAPPRKFDRELGLYVGDPLPWKTEQLNQLRQRYAFDYVVVDKRIQRQPPLLEIVYPVGAETNNTFAVFRMPAQPH